MLHPIKTHRGCDQFYYLKCTCVYTLDFLKKNKRRRRRSRAGGSGDGGGSSNSYCHHHQSFQANAWTVP
jgi:hypothetical protein